MNGLAIPLLWCVLQVTLLSLVAGALYLALRRLGPAARSLVPLTALLLVAALSVLALSPWPRWSFGADSSSQSSEQQPRVEIRGSTSAANADKAPNETNPPATFNPEEPSFAAEFWDVFTSELRQPQAGQPQAPQNGRRQERDRSSQLARGDDTGGRSLAAAAVWPARVAGGLLTFLVLCGVARLLGGLVAVRLCRRRSRPLDDGELREQLDVLRAELGCRPPVELRETSRLVTAAVVGWRRPVILLPPQWREWSPTQRRAVLAHEVAHVARNDFLSWLAAQIGLVLHFYHPLVHWLAGRLRLEQELAADAVAASVVGGNQTYLKALAELALRQPEQPVSWPARTFLPTRRTFLRRIEMLRNVRGLPDRVSRWKRSVVIAVMLGIGIAVAGFRNLPGDDVTELPAAEKAAGNPDRTDRASVPLTEQRIGARKQELDRELSQIGDSTDREKVEKDLKAIAKAMLDYYEHHKCFPPAIASDGIGGNWSWRVALLPYLGHGKLRSEYRVNRPWNSPENLTLLKKMPDVYRHPRQPEDATNPAYFAVTGREAVIDLLDTNTGGTRISEITDGPINTIMIVEAKLDIPWTKPGDLTMADVLYGASTGGYGAASRKPGPHLEGYQQGVVAALFADGAVKFLPTTISREKLRALLTKAGGDNAGDASPASSPAAQSDQEWIQGEWIVESLYDHGTEEPEAKGARFTFSRTNFVLGKGDEVEEQGTFSLDPTKAPKQISMHRKGHVQPEIGIYELKDGRLRIALGRDKRPESFSPEAYAYFVLKRAEGADEVRRPVPAAGRPATTAESLGTSFPSSRAAGSSRAASTARSGSDSVVVGEAPEEVVGEAPETSGPGRPPLSLAYVPRDAIMVAAVRPAELLKREALKPLAERLQKAEGAGNMLFGIPLSRVEQLTLVFLPQTQQNKPGAEPDQAGYIFRMAEPIKREQLAAVLGDDPEPVEYGGATYYKSSKRRAIWVYRPNETTVIISDKEPYLRRIIVAGERGASRASWFQPWYSVAGVSLTDFLLFVDFSGLRARLDAEFGIDGVTPKPLRSLAALAPLWQKARHVVVGGGIGEKGLRIHGTVVADDPQQVGETLQAARILARNYLSQAREQASRLSDEQGGPLMLKGLDVADEMLDELNIEVQPGNENVLVSSSVKDGAIVARLAATLAPAVGAAREAARRTQSMNNLKRIALAFHNYHDVYGHFPPAVVTHKGPKKLKHPHSWRVAILPFVDAAALYEKYRFDEPWDSDHNKEILKQMPNVFRHPAAEEGSTNACYFGLVTTGKPGKGDADGGKSGVGVIETETKGGSVFQTVEGTAHLGTVFDGEQGIRIRDITDGTSNTLLVVEAKRDIPWTKPEDIPYNPDKPLPKLGGFRNDGFNAAFCDGAVRFISKEIEETTLRRMITRNDGQPLNRRR